MTIKPYIVGYWFYASYDWELLINSHPGITVTYGAFTGIEISKEDILFLKLKCGDDIEISEQNEFIGIEIVNTRPAVNAITLILAKYLKNE